MLQHVLLALFLIGIPFAYAVNNTEIECDIPNPTGHCYYPLKQSENATYTSNLVMVDDHRDVSIYLGLPLLGVLSGIILVAVLILFGKDISKFIKKQ